jgi:hypothetical protein
MPSTYTSNNGIEKIGTGEQSGTWGDTTNVNFDIVDRALDGVGSISLSGTTHTLTTSDGSLSEGQYRVLVFGGSPSGTNTVTITPNDQGKFYLVDNQSGQTVVFTQGSGGNGTIPDGEIALVYADGAGAGAKVVATTFSDLSSAQTLTNKTLNTCTVDFDTTADEFQIGGTSVTVTAAELNALDGATVTADEINILDGATITTTELNTLDGAAGTLFAFGNINGDSGAVLRAGGNIDAVSQSAVGVYEITMTVAASDTNYTVVTTTRGRAGAPVETPSSSEADRAYQAQPVITSSSVFSIYTGGADGTSNTDLNLFEMDAIYFAVYQ